MARPELRHRIVNCSTQSTVMRSRSCSSFENISISVVCMLVGVFVNAQAQSGATTFSQKNSKQVSQQGSKTPGSEQSTVRKSSVGYLGVYLGDVNSDRARELKLSEPRGAVVGKVEEGSPGSRAGLRENDVILSFNEQTVENRTQFHRLLESAVPGSKVMLGISRAGKMQSVPVTLGERYRATTDECEKFFGEANAILLLADEKQQQAEALKLKGDEKGAAEALNEAKEIRRDGEERRAFVEKELREGRIKCGSALAQPEISSSSARFNLGLTAIELGDQLAKFFNVTGPGVLVTEIRAGELAERVGIKAGDCIVMINGKQVSSPNDLTWLRGKDENKEPDEMIVTIVRNRVEQNVKVKLDSR